MSKKQAFKIAPGIFDRMVEIQKDLPGYATGGRGGNSYETPAALCMLGMKDNIIDRVIELKMTGGCWDAPNITHKNMDVGFQKMIKEDRIVIGMALLRHPEWHIVSNEKYLAKMSSEIKRAVHEMRNTFSDITKTVWIVLHNEYFRIYRPSIDASKRLLIKEIKARSALPKTDKVVKKVCDKEKKIKENRAARKAIQKAEHAKENEKRDSINKALKEKKLDKILIGNGLCYMKVKGEYILWRE